MKGWGYNLQQSMDLGEFQLAMFTEESVRRYLIYNLPISLLRSFGIGEDHRSWCGNGVECHWFKVEAMATMSSPTSVWGHYCISRDSSGDFRDILFNVVSTF